MKAAQYLGVPPWELSGRPLFWMEAAEAARDAEAHAEKMHEKQAARPGA